MSLKCDGVSLIYALYSCVNALLGGAALFEARGTAALLLPMTRETRLEPPPNSCHMGPRGKRRQKSKIAAPSLRTTTVGHEPERTQLWL